MEPPFWTFTEPTPLEEGTLKEFNALYEGGDTPRETQLIEYVRQVSLSSDDQKLADSIPPGGFGVWEGAPVDGFFALFEMQGTEGILDTDAEHFRSIIGSPILVMETTGQLSMDAPLILQTLAETIKGKQSGKPSDKEVLKAALTRMKSRANQSFRSINLVATIQPSLVCWMELRR